MYNSLFSKACALTLACALLIFGGSLNVLYADNDPCYKNPKCPGRIKRVRKKGHRLARAGSQPRGAIAKNAPNVGKKRGETIPIPTQSGTAFVAGNQSSFVPGAQFEVPTTTLSQPGSYSLNLIPRTVDFDNTIASAPLNSVEAALQRGYDLIAIRKHKEATKQFEEILITSPQEARAYNGIGDVHMAKNRHSKAIVAYRKALELAPQNAILSDKLQKAIAIENEQDKVNRDRKIGMFLKLLAGVVLGATQSHYEQKQQQQFGSIVPPTLPQLTPLPKKQ